MPHKKSAIKRLRQDDKLRQRNKAVRSKMLTAVKRAQTAEPAEREQAMRQAVSAIDRAVKAGVIKRATGDRRKSSLMRQLGAKPAA